MIKRIINLIRLKFSNPHKRAKIFEDMGVQMGENCQIFSQVTFGSEPYLIKLGNNVKITTGCTFITHDGGVEVLRNIDFPKTTDYFGTIKIGNNVFIGNHCIILPGVSIGDNCVIGAGSIVTKNIESNMVVAGVPAREIKTLDAYAQKIKNGMDRTKLMNKSDKELYLRKKYNSFYDN